MPQAQTVIEDVKIFCPHISQLTVVRLYDTTATETYNDLSNMRNVTGLLYAVFPTHMSVAYLSFHMMPRCHKI